MTRKAPEFPETLRSQTLLPTTKASLYTIDLITALFGGGVQPARNDEFTPIRVPSIRGHLRFWWRAVRGAGFPTAIQLAREEGRIWGTTSDRSRVEITVAIKAGPESESSSNLLNSGPLGYVLFPFREHKPLPNFIRKLQFTLSLRYPEDMEVDVRASVWAWVNFGGIGARTRRGCGALFCREMAPGSSNEMDSWLQRGRKEFAIAKHPIRDWPALAAVHVLRRPGTPQQAWNKVIDLLHKFRQGEIARGQRGRTRWPEADSLRAVIGKPNVRSTPLTNLASDPAFPRARLGLPIVFHFKDSDDQFELYPAVEGSSRMASPLILRPLSLGSNSKAVPMIVQLRARAHRPLKFTYAEGSDAEKQEFGPFGERAIARPELATYQNSPMTDLSNKGSSLVAFLALAKREGFEELK